MDRRIGALPPPPLEVFRVCPTGRRPGQTQNSLQGLHIPSGLGTPRDPPRDGVSLGRGCLGLTPGSVSQPKISERQLMDGWMDERMDGRTDGWMDERMDERTDGWMDGWTDGWMNRRVDG